MVLTNEQLNVLFFGDLASDSFFSEGTVIMIDGNAWKLVEVVGSSFVFEASDDIATATENLDFFAERLHG